MHHIVSEYKGELRTKVRHLQSGNEIITDAPVDNHGKGESFSPYQGGYQDESTILRGQRTDHKLNYI